MTADPFALDRPAYSPEQATDIVLAADERPAFPEKPVAAPVETKPPNATKSGASTRGVAFGGKAVVLRPMPEAPQWPVQTVDDAYIPEEFDASDLSILNREMNRCRARLFRVSQGQKNAQRDLRESELLYNRNMRRALVRASGGSAEVRKAVAEMECEEFENDVVVKVQIVEELRKRAQDVRDDLKAVENLSHNARAQMAVQ